ncbi:MAG TPA: hypothetical protein VIJ66_05760 [Solirubrobacteraceae bacterium]
MRITGHGLSIDAPQGWEARIFRRDGAAPVLHVATFALREQDGDFGAAASGRMRPDDAFASLVEYRGDAVVRAGVGLFSAIGRPATLRAHDFGPAQLQVTRAGQLGCQRFFTDVGRPFCLYAAIRPAGKGPGRLARELSGVLATLELSGR